MKKAQSLVILLGVFILGAIGYYFYISYSSIEDPTAYEDLFVTDEYAMLERELDDAEYEDLELEYELSELESLDFDEEFNEDDIETEIQMTEEAEMDIEEELIELESFDF